MWAAEFSIEWRNSAMGASTACSGVVAVQHGSRFLRGMRWLEHILPYTRGMTVSGWAVVKGDMGVIGVNRIGTAQQFVKIALLGTKEGSGKWTPSRYVTSCFMPKVKRRQ